MNFQNERAGELHVCLREAYVAGTSEFLKREARKIIGQSIIAGAVRQCMYEGRCINYVRLAGSRLN